MRGQRGHQPDVGSSMKTMEGLATSSTAMVKRFLCSTDKPVIPGIPTCSSRSLCCHDSVHLADVQQQWTCAMTVDSDWMHCEAACHVCGITACNPQSSLDGDAAAVRTQVAARMSNSLVQSSAQLHQCNGDAVRQQRRCTAWVNASRRVKAVWAGAPSQCSAGQVRLRLSDMVQAALRKPGRACKLSSSFCKHALTACCDRLSC